MEILMHPQPVGVFPMPAGLLLLPFVAEHAGETLRRLLRADRSAALPEKWAFFSESLKNEPAASIRAPYESQLDAYNGFVLSGNVEEYLSLRKVAESPISTLLEIAAYYHGLTDHLPAFQGLDGELLALALMMRASKFLEDQHPDEALNTLTDAVNLVRVISPVFAIQLLGQIVQLMPVDAKAISLCRNAVELLEECSDDRICAETWIHLGQVCQDYASSQNQSNTRPLLVEAAQAYQQALRFGITQYRHPDLFALAQCNSGLAYLAMPMSGEGDKLRVGVAIQSFREALKVYDRESTPELWVSTQLNLANALQYMHSAHPEENLRHAVEIYEELLSMRNRALDPVGYARLLANQANALAHLGLFAPAMTKANEAHKLLHWHNESELAATMLNLTNEINKRLGNSDSQESQIIRSEVVVG